MPEVKMKRLLLKGSTAMWAQMERPILFLLSLTKMDTDLVPRLLKNKNSDFCTELIFNEFCKKI